jgi:poly(A) polymerase
MDIKGLLTEGVKETMAVEFLSNEVKNSKWKGKVFIAGGAVRDELLGLDLKDIDLVVEFPDGGIEFANWLTRKLGIWSSSNPVIYPRFGTAKFNLRGVKYKGVDLSDIDVECVMTRTEVYDGKTRKPEVGYGTIAQDAERRDFTVNSLMKDLSSGEILDLTGMGKSDIQKGIVRSAIDPNIIFKEDPLRMLRAIRFAVKYNWTLPLYMIKALKANAHMLKNISAERIQDELNKMLVTKSPDTAVRLLQMTDLNKYVAPELDLLIGLQQNKYHKWDANKHTLEVLKGVPADLKTRLAALFHDIGKWETKTVVDNAVHFS